MSKITFNSNNPKTQQFEEELNELLAEYQYELSAEMQYSPLSIKSVLQLRDVAPKKDARKFRSNPSGGGKSAIPTPDQETKINVPKGFEMAGGGGTGEGGAGESKNG